MKTALLRQISSLIEVSVLLLIDYISIFILYSIALWIRVKILPHFHRLYQESLPEKFSTFFFLFMFIYIIIFLFEGIYTKRIPFWREYERLIKGSTLAILIIFSIVSIGKFSPDVSRTVLLLGYILVIVFLPLIKLLVKPTVLRLLGLKRRIFIVASIEMMPAIKRAIENEPYLSAEIVGEYLFHEGSTNIDNECVKDIISNLNYVKATTLIIGLNGPLRINITSFIRSLKDSNVDIFIIPDLYGIPLLGIELDYFFNEQLMIINVKNRLKNPFYRITKRIFDIVVGTLLLIFSMPLMLLIAILIKLDSKGSIIYKHRRIGYKGREFDCLKFRTMVEGADKMLTKIISENPKMKEEWDKYKKIPNDPRITRFGKFLRKTSLDELPQLINVIKGEMSLVGPRPVLYEELELFKEGSEYYLEVKPGITGLWQISGRSDLDFQKRVELESWYVKNYSLWLDITVIIRTIKVVITKAGAY
ncbi:MAG: sugar transferase [Deltaproteobacteria bacterium]|nr:sugar transferase [Deltaproteobacteria bacterium]